MEFKQKDVMEKKEYILHTTKLNEFDSLEKQIEYWCEHLPTKSLFQPLKCEDSKYELDFDRYKTSDILIVLENEINRLQASETDSLLSFSILDSFYERCKSENNDFEPIKTHYIKVINDRVKADYGPMKLIKHGFRAYKGGDSMEIKLKDLRFIFFEAEEMEHFKYVYEGYLLAMAEREIKAFEGQRSENTVSTNYIGLFIYAFDLHNNTIFNKLNLGPSDKAKLFAKVFNLGDSQVENLRKAMSSPGGMVSKPFLKWFKQFDIDPKDTELRRFLDK